MLVNDTDYEKIKQYLNKEHIFDKKIPNIVQTFIDAMDFKGIDVPNDIKVAMVTFWLSVFSTQFRIKVNYRNIVPLNSLFFIFAPSSTGKDLTYTQLRNIFQESLDIIYEQIDSRFNAIKEKDDNLVRPALEVGFSTSEGLLKNISTLSLLGIGETFIYSGEFVSEFVSNPNSSTMIRDLVELVGTGIKHQKQVKTEALQTKKIEGSGLSAMFATDLSRVSGDTNLLTKFKLIFREGLARRSNVVLIKEIERQEIVDFFAYMNEDLNKEAHQETLRQKVIAKIKSRTKELIESNMMGHTYELDRECRELMYIYTGYLNRYVEDLKKSINNKELISLYVLHKKDNEFRTIRLASSIALLKGDMTLKREHIVDAIKLIEYLNIGMQEFEKELNKTLPDIFVDFCSINKTDEPTKEYTAAELHKAGFITSRIVKNSLNDLCLFANQIDKNSFYETDGKIITHTQLIENIDGFDMSFKDMTGLSKEQRHTLTANGFNKKHFNTFADIKEVLSNDCAYSNFTFKDGHRSNDNIETMSSLFVFDIDNSHIPYNLFHKLIKDINHHIAKTSDDTNPNKFRVIVELDKKYNLDIRYYSKIREYILKNYLLNITSDKLSIAQAYYGYKEREVLSVTDKKKIPLKEIMTHIQLIANQKALSKQEKQSMLNDTQLTPFAYALNRGKGERNLMLIRVLNHLRDLDATYEQAKEIIIKINETYEPELTDEELEKMIFPHLNKHFKE